MKSGQESVCAVVVTFNPKIDELRDNIAALLMQADVVLVDNSTSAGLSGAIGNFVEGNLTVLMSGENVGIASAQNRGIAEAFALGYDYVLLMDQDSWIPKGMITALVQSSTRLANSGIQVACVGPLAISADGRAINPVPHARMECVCVPQTLSSGKLIHRDAYLAIGGMEDGLFIDLVDYEWCWRARALGYLTYVRTDQIMRHSLGIGSRGFGVIRIPTAVRHYYQYRNGILMLRRSYVPWQWKLKMLLVLPAKLCVYPFLLAPRLARLRYMLRGIADAFAGRSGRCPVSY